MGNYLIRQFICLVSWWVCCLLLRSNMSPIYLLLLPALVYGKLIIDIDITDVTSPLLDARMQERASIITDEDKEAFKIEDEQLKKAIAKATNGTQPSEVSTKTTKNVDLHKKHKWEEVKRTIKPIFKFNKTCEGTVHEIEKSIDTVESNWQLQGNISSDIEYDLYIRGGTPNFNATYKLGDNFKNSTEYHFKNSVHAQKCVIDIHISYYTSLSGRVAANYLTKRLDHYHWGYDVNYILIGAKLPTQIVNNQTITISYYESTRVKK